ncbi:hypothetical protein FGIG_03177 [Fasciola gigantica]|uniref:Uncharacterized protein n=1 Tax=Fasciola gigantica TaxID=46835 RepID=A0A504Z073_FASGI|nr:hypothetical protein FGIG_03177 [Fasciola gigantica]
MSLIVQNKKEWDDCLIIQCSIPSWSQSLSTAAVVVDAVVDDASNRVCAHAFSTQSCVTPHGWSPYGCFDSATVYRVSALVVCGPGYRGPSYRTPTDTEEPYLLADRRNLPPHFDPGRRPRPHRGRP